MQGPEQANRGILAATLLFLLAAAGCSLSPRTTLSQLAPLNLQQIPRASLTRVRVLLLQDFRAASIEHSSRGERLQVVAQAGRLVLLQSGGNLWVDEATGFRFQPAEGRLLALNGAVYRGSLEAFVNPVGHTVLVNELPLEDYLRGVVPNELGPHVFPQLAALEAQSVAARTYTVAGRRRFAHLGFDLYGNERSQVYRGIASEHPLSDQAVSETAGRVVLFRNQPIEAFYSSTCGGVTADYTEAFQGEPIEYLEGGVSCPDDESRFHRWSVRVDPALVEANLAPTAVGRLRTIEILSRGSTGRVTATRFSGKSGEVTLGGLETRRVLGLRSHFLDRLEAKRDEGGWITAISVTGRGFGHGVGMCQIGAVALSRQGKGFEEILRTYYPGTSLARIY